MKLISLNVEFNKHLERILPFLEKERPDVFCAQEILEEDISTIKNILGYDAVFAPWSYITHDLYREQKGKRQGVAIFAKKILASDHAYYLGGKENIDIPFEQYVSPFDGGPENKVAVWADISNEDGKTFRIVTTHLPVTMEGATTPGQLHAVHKLLETLAPLGELVLCGDTNAPRGKEAFALLAEKYTDSIPQQYTTSIDQHLHRTPGLQFMVDGLFLSSGYTASDVRLVDGVSDHMAIVGTIEKTII